MIAERGSDLAHAVVQAVFKIDEGMVVPDLPTQFIAGDYFAGVGNKQGQDLCRLRLQLNSLAALSQHAVLNFEFERPEAKHRITRGFIHKTGQSFPRHRL